MKKLVLFAALLLTAWSQATAQFTTKTEVADEMKRVADWQIESLKKPRYGDLNWVNATFYLGLSRWAGMAEQIHKDGSYYKWLTKLGNRNYWQVGQRMYHADDICVAQTYLDMYRKYRKEAMMIPTRARMDWVIANPSRGTFELSYSDPSSLEMWTWCDALFMAPPAYLKMYRITGDKKYIDFMDREYKRTYDYLYDKADSLFYRDSRYIPMKEANGRKVFWGRGNGWVLGGLAEILELLPTYSDYRPFYQKLFVEMAYRVVKLQDKDGFWRASMLDPDSYPSPETSASAFFVYGLAYGINTGILPKEDFMSAVEKGWKALVSAVEKDGKLGYVQPIGADPKSVTKDMTEVYGPGAFLLAGSEIYKMAE